MKLRIATLHDGPNPVEEILEPGAVGLDPDTFTDPVKIQGTVVADERKLDLRLNVQTQGQYTCDRCASDFKRDFDVDMRVEVLKREAEDLDEEEAEGLIFIGPEGSEVDISQEIVDALLLDLPIQVLCRRSCKGLCPFCYVDLNETEHKPECPVARGEAELSPPEGDEAESERE